FAGGERRLLAVVLIERAADGAAAAPDEQALRDAVGPDAGGLEQLADGATAVVIEANQQVASDQAAPAAPCAPALHAIAPGRAIAIAMGRAEAGRRRPEDVLGRAAHMLAQAARAPGDPPEIAVDEMSAGLLDARFDVVERETGLALRGERVLMVGT